MNSIPQQAVAKGNGQRAFLRAHAARASTRVVTKSASPPAAFALWAGRTGWEPLILPPARILTRADRRSAEVDGIRQRFHVAHPIEVDESIQVIDLVLDDPRVVPGRLEIDGRAGSVQGAHPNRRETRHDSSPQER